MTRIVVRSKDLTAPIEATLAEGEALLVGREPDPTRIDWAKLPTSRGPFPLLSAQLQPSAYRVRALHVPSARTSANHLLILKDATCTALFELSSRNGSWIRLDPQTPAVLAGAYEISLALAGPPQHELRVSRPPDPLWSADAEYGAAMLRAIQAWLADLDTSLMVVRRPAGSVGGSNTTGIVLADDSVLEIQEQGTLQVGSAAIIETLRSFVYEQNARHSQLKGAVSDLIVGSQALRRILWRVADGAASGRRTVLLGPTGVGKELLARSYHRYSRQNHGPFVTVNCALLEKDLLYAQLFGARRGSFTGANTDVVGMIEAAHGGSLFLDELGEMNPEVQKAMLRFLDSRGEYYRLGDPRPRRSETQIVCATNAPLDVPAFREGRFRDDLWYRLASCVIHIPPLRERPEDIRAYLAQRTLPNGTLPILSLLTPEALELIVRDPWPGNLRDLENFIERLPAVTRPGGIDAAACEAALHEGRPHFAASPSHGAHSSDVRPNDSALAATVASSVAVAATPTVVPRLQVLDENDASRDPRRLASTNLQMGWDKVVTQALRAFLEDHGSERPGWDQLHLLIERYLKPVFVAQAVGPRSDEKGGRSGSYAALARRLLIGDGSTVKTHLQRYEERFGTVSPSGEPQAERSFPSVKPSA